MRTLCLLSVVSSLAGLADKSGKKGGRFWAGLGFGSKGGKYEPVKTDEEPRIDEIFTIAFSGYFRDDYSKFTRSAHNASLESYARDFPKFVQMRNDAVALLGRAMGAVSVPVLNADEARLKKVWNDLEKMRPTYLNWMGRKFFGGEKSEKGIRSNKAKELVRECGDAATGVGLTPIARAFELIGFVQLMNIAFLFTPDTFNKYDSVESGADPESLREVVDREQYPSTKKRPDIVTAIRFASLSLSGLGKRTCPPSGGEVDEYCALARDYVRLAPEGAKTRELLLGNLRYIALYRNVDVVLKKSDPTAEDPDSTAEKSDSTDEKPDSTAVESDKTVEKSDKTAVEPVRIVQSRSIEHLARLRGHFVEAQRMGLDWSDRWTKEGKLQGLMNVLEAYSHVVPKTLDFTYNHYALLGLKEVKGAASDVESTLDELVGVGKDTISVRLHPQTFRTSPEDVAEQTRQNIASVTRNVGFTPHSGPIRSPIAKTQQEPVKVHEAKRLDRSAEASPAPEGLKRANTWPLDDGSDIAVSRVAQAAG